MNDTDVPAAPTRRSLRAPARARHSRPLVLEPASGVTALATPLLTVFGVVLLATAAITLVSTRWSEKVAAEPVQAAVAPSTVELPSDLPTRIEIPRIEVAAPVTPRGVTVDQDLELPSFGETGWYKLGPSPGQDGHAVIAGHVDSRKGYDVFAQLHTLKRGQEVRVRMSSGAVVAFRVDEVLRQSKDALPESRMWESTGRPQLALITCGGKFNKKLRSYPDNIVVYATMSERRTPQAPRGHLA